MNGVHDMGGMHGFGAVERERDEPVFHAPWEGRVWAMEQQLLGRRVYNLDEFRYGIERMPPADYLASSYYERWLATIEYNLLVKGVVTTLTAIGLSVKSGGSAHEIDISGGMKTHGAGVAPIEQHGAIESLRIDGGCIAMGGGFE